MTRDEFVKVHFKAFMEVHYVHPLDNGDNSVFSCMLLGVDFQNEILTIEPFPTESGRILREPFHAHISYCKIPKPEPKKLKISR